MKAATWYNNKDIRIEQVPRPEPGAKEILAKVMACGVCGSDVVEWYRLPRAPMVPGHEVGAEVVAVGGSVRRFKPGDRVFVAPKVPCMQCDYCQGGHHPVCAAIKDRLPGGFSEYILVPEPLVDKGTYLLPERMSYDQSTFIEPLACVVRAQRLAGLKEGRAVMILGSGMSGLLHVKLAKSKSCRVIAVDIDPRRLALAERCGADRVAAANADLLEILEANGGRKPDTVILCTGAVSAVAQAWQCVDKGGTVVFFAVPGPDKKVDFPVNDFWMKEIRILTSYYCGPDDILAAVDLIAGGKIEVDDLITHRLPLEEILEGYARVIAGGDAVKVIIRPNG